MELTTGAAELEATELEETMMEQSSLEIPNWVEYWYWPVTSSISWSP